MRQALKAVLLSPKVRGIQGLPNHHASLGNVLQYERTQAWSVRATISKLGAVPTGRAKIVFTNVGGGNYEGYELFLNGENKLQVRIISHFFNNNYIGVSGSTVINGYAQRVAWATYDGSSTAAGVKIYCDGALETPTVEKDGLSATIVGADQNFYLTSQKYFDDEFFWQNGYIKNFLLDNVVRDATYVGNNSNPSVFPANDAGVTQVRLDMTEGQGVIARDSSGNNRHATLTTSAMWA